MTIKEAKNAAAAAAAVGCSKRGNLKRGEGQRTTLIVATNDYGSD